jgi:hypothetical protein
VSSDERGQSTVEWIGLLLLVSTALAMLATLAGTAIPGVALAGTITSKIVCAVELSDDCDPGESELVATYGTELAGEVAEHAPELVYEQGMRALPVDYRSCREDPCSLGPEQGEVERSYDGEPVTLFVHAVDCRADADPPPEEAGYDCSGERAGALYLQYWAYYPGSDTQIYGDAGFHDDDWESEQLRIGPAGYEARASSHQGYNYVGGPGNWLSDAGVTHRTDVWGPDRGAYFVSGGSHAGHASDDTEPYRWTPGDAVRLIPLEPIAASDPDVAFAITPPWLKRVWSDPEYGGTD